MTQHINPGTDTTINPVVIDDSYREKKPEYDPIFIGLINYFKEIQWQRVESEISVTEIIEILTDFAKMEAEEKASHTKTLSHPPEAQQRIDAEQEVIAAAMNWWMMQRPLDWSEEQHLKHPTINIFGNQERVLAEAIALLQAGDHHE